MTVAQLREAIELARTGKKAEARERLLKIIEQDPHNEVATLWYVDTLTSDDERVRILQKFVSENPNGEKAKSALKTIQARLSSRGSLPPTVTSQTQAETKIEQPLQAAAEPKTAEERPSSPKTTPPSPPPADEKAAERPAETVVAESENVVDVAAVPVAAIPARPKPEDFAPPYRRLAPPAKKESHVGTAVLIVIAILLVVACAGYVLIKGFLDNPAFKSPAAAYADEMEKTMKYLDEWINGPISEWEQAMAEEVYEGTTYQEAFKLNQQMGYVDVLVAEKLSPIANDIGMGGLTIDNAMGAITPPSEIETAHYQVLMCVRYEREWADAMIAFLDKNEPIELRESPCGNFMDAYNQLVGYVNQYQ